MSGFISQGIFRNAPNIIKKEWAGGYSEYHFPSFIICVKSKNSLYLWEGTVSFPSANIFP